MYADKINLKILAKRIKELRRNKNRSLNKFINENGNLTTATWSRIENAKVALKFSTLLKVAAVLKIDVIELLKDLDFDYTIEDE